MRIAGWVAWGGFSCNTVEEVSWRSEDDQLRRRKMEVQEILFTKTCIYTFLLSSIKHGACDFPLVEEVLFSLDYASIPDARLAVVEDLTV